LELIFTHQGCGSPPPTATGTPPTPTETSTADPLCLVAPTPRPITFTDVDMSNPFWVYVERVALHGVISGYNTSPPCPAGQTSCFGPGDNVPRGPAAEIVANTFIPTAGRPRGHSIASREKEEVALWARSPHVRVCQWP